MEIFIVELYDDELDDFFPEKAFKSKEEALKFADSFEEATHVCCVDLVEGVSSFNSGFNIAKDTAVYFCLDYARKCLENDNEEAEDVAMYLSEAISKISSPY